MSNQTKFFFIYMKKILVFSTSNKRKQSRKFKKRGKFLLPDVVTEFSVDMGMLLLNIVTCDPHWESSQTWIKSETYWQLLRMGEKACYVFL